MAFTYLITFGEAWLSKSSAFQKFDTHLVYHVEDPGGGNNDYHDSKPVILGRSLEILIAECISNVRKSEQWTYYLHVILLQASCTYEFAYTFILREGFKKSKWKFKMAFAMKGGGSLEGVSSAINLFWKMIFLKTI